MVDTGDLKSPGSNSGPVRVRSPAPSGSSEYRGVEQLAARRAHNPEVGGSSPPSATISVTVVDTISTTVIFYFPLVLGAYRIKMGVFRTFPAEN